MSRPSKHTGPQIAVVGAFRSGTNFVQFLLERNYLCVVDGGAHGWKHAPIARPYRDDCQDIPMVVVAKNPFAFLTSLFDYRIEVDRNIDSSRNWGTFLTSPISIYDTDPSSAATYRFANPVAYWNDLYANLTNLPPQSITTEVLVYEDCLKDPEGEISRTAKSLGLVRGKNAFLYPTRKISRGKGGLLGKLMGGSNRETHQSFTPEKYLTHSYLDRYTDTQLKFVADAADPELLARFGMNLTDILNMRKFSSNSKHEV